MNKQIGILYVVATPIGNLDDITYRAVKILQSVNGILAEDTRHTRILLNHYQIRNHLISLHNFNEEQRAPEIISRLQQGENLALVSDAGTPLISDPGERLLTALLNSGIRVVPIPGPSALITALSASGLSTERFCFEGFLPAKSKERMTHLELLSHETRTMVFYEAPHRLLETLKAIASIFGGDRWMVIGRELTKKFEAFYRDRAEALVDYFSNAEHLQRGELVLMVQGESLQNEPMDGENQEVVRILSILMSAELPLRQAVDLSALITKRRKNEVYKLALEHHHFKDGT